MQGAIETLFPLNTENAILYWHSIAIPLSYKYDLSVMCEDVLDMIEALAAEESGQTRIVWPSNTFSASWSLTWKCKELTCVADWHQVVGGLQDLLNQQQQISMPLEDFAAEWGTLLEHISHFLKSAGYTSENLRGLGAMLSVIDRIQRPGVLYRST